MKTTLDNQVPAKRLDSDVTNQKAVQILAYILVAVDIIMIAFVLFMRTRIKLAIGIIKESGRALARMPSIMAFPIIVSLTFARAW